MWFRDLVGFEETTADAVRSQMVVDGERMTSLVNGRVMACGALETPSLAQLRERTADLVVGAGASRLREIVGDVGAIHRDPSHAGATFQAASQFNLLEMVSPTVGPEAGVDGYEHDHTQGPTCAIACGAGTIYRNYFVEVDGQPGQTAAAQIDCLRGIGEFLFPGEDPPWKMQNGYALFDRHGLERINGRLDSMDEEEVDAVRAELRIGVHQRVEVTTAPTGHLVTQAYCSALPVAYHREPAQLFAPLARIVLDATYEATLRAAVISAAQSGNRTVLLTKVGGGVFGNDESWIVDAIIRALRTVADAALDIAVVSYGSPDPAFAAIG